MNWWALPRCPRCYRAWTCWTTQAGHRPRMMTRPHFERLALMRR